MRAWGEGFFGDEGVLGTLGADVCHDCPLDGEVDLGDLAAIVFERDLLALAERVSCQIAAEAGSGLGQLTQFFLGGGLNRGRIVRTHHRFLGLR